MKKHHRGTLFVDRRIQGAILVRTLLYWGLCVVLVFMLMLCSRIVSGPSRDLAVHIDHLFAQYRWVFLASLILLPLLVADTLRLSNRVVGPLIRLRRAMNRLAEGGDGQGPVVIRKGDYCGDLADDFNRLLARIQNRESAPSSMPESESETSTAPGESNPENETVHATTAGSV